MKRTISVKRKNKKYPKTAAALGVIAFIFLILGFKNSTWFFFSGIVGWIALIFALGPDSNQTTYIVEEDDIPEPTQQSNLPQKRGGTPQIAVCAEDRASYLRRK